MAERLILQGCGTALVTPFAQGKVDYDSFRALVARQTASGVDFLLPLGTTGETPCLSDDERARILEITREEAGGKPVIVGGGTNSLRDTLASMRFLESFGPDAFLIVTPYYNKPTQQGLYDYFKAVAEAASKPVILYNVPGRTGVNLSAATCLRLAREVPGIVAVKEASGNFTQVSEILKDAPEGFTVLSGDDDLTLALMAAGASGVISVASNLAPKEVSEMTHRALEGDFVAARVLHHKLSPLFKACFVESNPIPAKAGLAALGLCRGEVRLPLTEASGQTKRLMSEVVSDLGL